MIASCATSRLQRSRFGTIPPGRGRTAPKCARCSPRAAASARPWLDPAGQPCGGPAAYGRVVGAALRARRYAPREPGSSRERRHDLPPDLPCAVLAGAALVATASLAAPENAGTSNTLLGTPAMAEPPTCNRRATPSSHAARADHCARAGDGRRALWHAVLHPPLFHLAGLDADQSLLVIVNGCGGACFLNDRRSSPCSAATWPASASGTPPIRPR